MTVRPISLVAVAISALLVSSVSAQSVSIERDVLGSGVPGTVGYESASPVLSNDILHAPQYMAAYPTAATIWPRIVEVPCIKTAAGLQCEGYRWTPKMGRGEYLFFTPVVVEAPKPVIEQIFVPFAVPGPARTILKEVPVKPKKE